MDRLRASVALPWLAGMVVPIACIAWSIWLIGLGVFLLV